MRDERQLIVASAVGTGWAEMVTTKRDLTTTLGPAGLDVTHLSGCRISSTDSLRWSHFSLRIVGCHRSPRREGVLTPGGGSHKWMRLRSGTRSFCAVAVS